MKKNKLSNMLIVLFLFSGMTFLSCKGRVPPPADPKPSDSAAPSGSPSPTDDPQPKNADDFWKKMKAVGFTKTKEELTPEIKKQMSLKIAAWEKDLDKKSFDANKDKFTPPVKDLADFQKRSLAFALRKDLDLYLDPVEGPKNQAIYMKKIDNKTFEVLHFTSKATITNYSQEKAGPKVTQLLFIPPDVYK